MKYIIAILIAVIIGISFSYWTASKNWQKEKGVFVLNDSLLQTREKTYRDSANREIVKFSVQSINTDQLLTSKSAEALQLKKDLDIAHAKLKDVNSSTSVSSTTQDTVRISVDHIITKADTGTFAIPFHSEPDTFLSIEGSSIFKRVDTNSYMYKAIDINYKIKNNSTVTYYNQSQFLKKPKLQLLISQDNPHTTTGKVQTYYITPDKKWYQRFWVHAVVGSAATIVVMHYIK